MKKLSILLGVSLLAACSTTEETGLNAYSQAQAIKGQGGVYKVGKPYTVMGQTYAPEENYSYSETGMASWYGHDFHAKKTANNEDYDMNTLTAAHRTLPLPSIVKVTNLENGRSLVLRVNDRGPFVKNRIIDISKRGAQLLGFQAQGTAKVRVDLLDKESLELKNAMLSNSTDPLEEKSIRSVGAAENVDKNNYGAITTSTVEYAEELQKEGGIYVQAGSFSQKISAEALKNNLSEVGIAKVAQADINGQNFYRVRFGPYQKWDDAQVALDKVQTFGITNAKIIQD